MEKFDKIQDIPFDKTIELFQSNNSIILIFNYKEPKNIEEEKNETPKKIPKNKTYKHVRFNLKQSNKTLKKTT